MAREPGSASPEENFLTDTMGRAEMNTLNITFFFLTSTFIVRLILQILEMTGCGELRVELGVLPSQAPRGDARAHGFQAPQVGAPGASPQAGRSSRTFSGSAAAPRLPQADSRGC